MPSDTPQVRTSDAPSLSAFQIASWASRSTGDGTGRTASVVFDDSIAIASYASRGAGERA
jgi:hypothetical protein